MKSARDGKVQLKDSFVELRDREAWLVRAHIGPYTHGNRQNHEPERARKLLLKRREIERLGSKVQMKGLTVVPLRVLARGSWIKVEIALVQGKKLHDKRERERERELDREMDQALKQAAGSSTQPFRKSRASGDRAAVERRGGARSAARLDPGGGWGGAERARCDSEAPGSTTPPMTSA